MAGARRKREVRRIVAVALGFALIAPAFPASDRHRAGGGSWLDGYLTGVLILSVMAVPVVAAMLFMVRPQGDGMPAALLASSEPAGSEDEEPWRMPESERRSNLAFFTMYVLLAPFGVYKGLQEGPAVLAFMACSIPILAVLVHSFWRSPRTIVLGTDALHVETQSGGEIVIPLSTVTEICQRPAYVDLHHDGGQLTLSKRIAGLGDLVLAVRRRNPAIAYEGRWPITR